MDTVDCITELRVCTQCKQGFPATIEWFYHSNNRKGWQSRCKKCMAENNTAYNRKVLGYKPKRQLRVDGNRICTKCDVSMPETLENFRLNSKGLHRSTCRTCENAYKRVARKKDTPARAIRLAKERVQSSIRYAKNKAVYNANRKVNPKAILAARAQAAKRRARLAQVSGKFTRQDVEAQYKSQKGLCYWCDCQLNGSYEIDHIFPIAKGGSNEPNNICCACYNCNRSKGAKTPTQWKGRLF
jgi:5-methylcytosine-specific restriction endonuclease McrA